MRVGGPRVGALVARRRARRSRGDAAAQSPKAPSTCTQAPCRCATSIASAIGSNAPECRLPACRQTIVGPLPSRQRALEVVDDEPALVVGGDGRRRPEPEVAQREVEGLVPLRADEHPDPRTAREPVAARRPSPRRRAPAARGRREPGEVGHGRAGDEPDVGAGGQPEQVERPRGRRVLHRHDARRRVAHRRVLVPRAGEPVRRERGRVRAADDPAEEPPGRHPHEPGLDAGGQLVDDRLGRGRPVGERSAEDRGERVGVGPRVHRPLGQGHQPLARVVRRAVERRRERRPPCRHGVHPATAEPLDGPACGFTRSIRPACRADRRFASGGSPGRSTSGHVGRSHSVEGVSDRPDVGGGGGREHDGQGPAVARRRALR